jgi:tetratricopeptide (TPR) repeat protein
MNGSVPSIQVDESEHPHDDDEENHDSYASRQSEYDDSHGESLQHDDGSYYSQNDNVSYASHSQGEMGSSAVSFVSQVDSRFKNGENLQDYSVSESYDQTSVSGFASFADESVERSIKYQVEGVKAREPSVDGESDRSSSVFFADSDQQEDCSYLPKKANSKPKTDCGEMNPNDGPQVDFGFSDSFVNGGPDLDLDLLRSSESNHGSQAQSKKSNGQTGIFDSFEDSGTIDKEPSWRQDDHSNASFDKYEYGFDVRSQEKISSQSRRSAINEGQQAEKNESDRRDGRDSSKEYEDYSASYASEGSFDDFNQRERREDVEDDAERSSGSQEEIDDDGFKSLSDCSSQDISRKDGFSEAKSIRSAEGRPGVKTATQASQSVDEPQQSQKLEADQKKDEPQERLALKLPKLKTFGGYSRDQMSKVAKCFRDSLCSGDASKDSESSPPTKKSSGKKPNLQNKSQALLEFLANVNDAINELAQKEVEEEKNANSSHIEDKSDEKKEGNSDAQQEAEGKEESNKNKDSDVLLTPARLLYAFEALVGIFLQLSDELELLLTFSKGTSTPSIEALESLLAFSQTIDDTFVILKPILLHYLSAEIDEELDDFLYGMNLLMDLMCELSHRVGEKQQWNARANTSFVTMLELLARDTLEVSCIYEDIDTPEYEISDLIQDAWEATGHIEEVKTLMVTSDLFMFRQICYEVILSCDQWCPDNNTLMDICGVDDESENDIQPNPDDILAEPPEAALQILEKIHGDPLPRISTIASVLRRILPAQAITDPSLSENFARIRNTVRNPLGMPPSSIVAVTSIPEVPDDPHSLGVAGVGKSTIAAMVANHEDVRRFFNDGIAWISVGETELTYNRYVQCLQDLLSQLEVDEEEEPLFPELLHCPGDSYAVRRRKEEGFMIYLRETMVEFLRFRNVLIILDDVCHEPDLDWFDFAPAPLPNEEEDEEEGSCAILVTSRRRNLLPPADTVEVDMIDEDEGIELLIKESGELSRALVAEAPETRSVVLECACHPLTVKSVGRWLNLKHATASVGDEKEIHEDVVKSMERILKSGLQEDADMMYEILNMSLSPAINGEPTSIIKYCFAAFVRVFCDRKYISDFALADATPIVPMVTTELLFEALLELEEETLLKEGSLFYAQKNEAATLIPEALSALGVFKVIITYADAPDDKSGKEEEEDEKFLQIMHRIQQEYGEFLFDEDESLAELTKDGEVIWNKAFSRAFLAKEVEWDTESPDAGLDYALEMLPSHMLRGGMVQEASDLLCNEDFVYGRLSALGRENGTRRQIKDCEILYNIVQGKRSFRKKLDPKNTIRKAFDTLGSLLKMGDDEYIEEEGSPEAVEVGRCHFELGFALAEKRCWEGAISHWESSQEFLVSSLGMVELVAGILFNVGHVHAEMNEYDLALGALKQCLRIRGAIHGEEHILYAQTIQKIGDVFLKMSDYHEAMESYNWALDVMHIEPNHHRIDIGNILEQMGNIHYCKGEIDEALQSFQDALRSKQVDLGEDHPELASIYHNIGNCLSNQGRTDEAVAHLEEAIRLKKLDPDGGFERDSDVLTIEGIINNLNNRQQEGLECYEKSLQVLVTKAPHKKEKVAALLHLIGCVYLMSGEHKKAMKLFEESLHARRKVLGFVHLDVASTLFNMAFLHQTRGRLDKSLKCLEEALKIRQLRLPNSEKVAITHEKIGKLARIIGKTKKAEIAFTEALRIRKIINGSDHEAVATVLQELGDLADDLGESEDAMKKYVEALEIRENSLGPDDLAVAETYYSMGFTLQKTGALDRALQCLEESLSIRKFQLGDDAKEVGDTMNMMGFLQAKRGHLDDALALLWDALRIRKLHRDNVKVSETLNNIGNVHREKQEFELALECYEECLRIRRAELGDGNEKVADALIAMGNVQSDLDWTQEALDSYKEALAIRNVLFGEQDEKVATVLQYMGTLEFRANELDRAFQLLDEFIRIRQENGTEPDGDYVNVLFMIGNIHKMQNDEEEAKKCWTEAYGVFKKLGLAETNPQIAEVMSSLVSEEEMDASKGEKSGVLNRIRQKVKNAARTANDAGNAVKKVTGIKGQDRGSRLL